MNNKLVRELILGALSHRHFVSPQLLFFFFFLTNAETV